MRRALFVIVIMLMAASVSEARGEDDSGTPNEQSLVTRGQPDNGDQETEDRGLETEVDISEPLTLSQCIKVAFQRSPTIRMADLDLRSAELDVADAWANYLPEIDASGQYRFSDTIDLGWERQNYDAQIMAGYTIWDHGRREAGLAQAKASERSVQSDHVRTRQDLIFDITEAYYDLLQAEKMIDVDEKLLEISKGNVEKVTAFQEAGRSIPADVAAARVQQASDELTLINDQNNLELARARLASLMGLAPGAPVEVQDDPDYKIYTETALVTREVSLEDSIARAIQDRPELNSLHARLTSLEWSLKLARLNRWPVITAECNYDVLLDDYLRDREDFKKYRNWSAVARVSFPIFDGGISRRREQSAEIAVQQMKEDIGQRERAIKLEVQQVYLNLERSKKSLDIAREQVRNATESLNVTQGRYEQNMVIFLEVLSAQARYAQALTNQIRAFYDLKIAEKSLLKSMGTLQVED
jgi:outer membrane protein